MQGMVAVGSCLLSAPTICGSDQSCLRTSNLAADQVLNNLAGLLSQVDLTHSVINQLIFALNASISNEYGPSFNFTRAAIASSIAREAAAKISSDAVSRDMLMTFVAFTTSVMENRLNKLLSSDVATSLENVRAVAASLALSLSSNPVPGETQSMTSTKGIKILSMTDFLTRMGGVELLFPETISPKITLPNGLFSGSSRRLESEYDSSQAAASQLFFNSTFLGPLSADWLRSSSHITTPASRPSAHEILTYLNSAEAAPPQLSRLHAERRVDFEPHLQSPLGYQVDSISGLISPTIPSSLHMGVESPLTHNHTINGRRLQSMRSVVDSSTAPFATLTITQWDISPYPEVADVQMDYDRLRFRPVITPVSPVMSLVFKTSNGSVINEDNLPSPISFFSILDVSRVDRNSSLACLYYNNAKSMWLADGMRFADNSMSVVSVPSVLPPSELKATCESFHTTADYIIGAVRFERLPNAPPYPSKPPRLEVLEDKLMTALYSSYLFFAIIASIIMLIRDRKEAAKRKVAHAAAVKKYNKTLEQLSSNPIDINAEVKPIMPDSSTTDKPAQPSAAGGSGFNAVVLTEPGLILAPTVVVYTPWRKRPKSMFNFLKRVHRAPLMGLIEPRLLLYLRRQRYVRQHELLHLIFDIESRIPLVGQVTFFYCGLILHFWMCQVLFPKTLKTSTSIDFINDDIISCIISLCISLPFICVCRTVSEKPVAEVVSKVTALLTDFWSWFCIFLAGCVLVLHSWFFFYYNTDFTDSGAIIWLIRVGVCLLVDYCIVEPLVIHFTMRTMLFRGSKLLGDEKVDEFFCLLLRIGPDHPCRKGPLVQFIKGHSRLALSRFSLYDEPEAAKTEAKTGEEGTLKEDAEPEDGQDRVNEDEIQEEQSAYEGSREESERSFRRRDRHEYDLDSPSRSSLRRHHSFTSSQRSSSVVSYSPRRGPGSAISSIRSPRSVLSVPESSRMLSPNRRPLGKSYSRSDVSRSSRSDSVVSSRSRMSQFSPEELEARRKERARRFGERRENRRTIREEDDDGSAVSSRGSNDR
eukprot:GILI01008620.1.p1 GENE.GILI01008620.1~~GILI01008620.1.p1  ORF type:complete len:1116 (+),score=188.69 GILI01008620.1:223-3348(+)